MVGTDDKNMLGQQKAVINEVIAMKNKKIRCYVYIRVSTTMQVDGYSLDAQRDKLR